MIQKACAKLRFPVESIPVLQDGFDRIRALADKELQRACDGLMTVGNTDYLHWMQQISEKSGVHRYTADMVTLLYATERLSEAYRANGLPEQLMWESLDDLRSKVYECQEVHGIWGTFVTPWYPRFYRLQCFKLGRLVYEQENYAWDFPIAGLQKGDPVINIHIPSHAPLTPEAVDASLAKAWAFYRDVFSNDTIPFICHSWLLYPPVTQQVFPEGSRLRAFSQRFTVIGTKQDPDNKDFWRIFNRDYREDTLQQMPADTTLRKNMLRYLQAGNSMGFGAGVIWYQPK